MLIQSANLEAGSCSESRSEGNRSLYASPHRRKYSTPPPANQIRLSFPRCIGPLKQARHSVNLHIADRVEDVVVEDLMPFHVLPVLPGPVVKMHDIARNTGQ